ncbi:MAG: hypothetical protein AAGB15_06755 [Pseudomonadota bacterium]
MLGLERETRTYLTEFAIAYDDPSACAWPAETREAAQSVFDAIEASFNISDPTISTKTLNEAERRFLLERRLAEVERRSASAAPKDGDLSTDRDVLLALAVERSRQDALAVMLINMRATRESQGKDGCGPVLGGATAREVSARAVTIVTTSALSLAEEAALQVLRVAEARRSFEARRAQERRAWRAYQDNQRFLRQAQDRWQATRSGRPPAPPSPVHQHQRPSTVAPRLPRF